MVRARYSGAVGWLGYMAILASACSEPDDAPARCDDYVAHVCNKLADCLVSEGVTKPAARDTRYDECQSDVRAQLDCSRAVDTRKAYTTCLGELDSLSCPGVVSAALQGTEWLPASCDGVILLDH